MTTYYINADTGNNTTGTGTSILPWLTLAKAVTSSAVGDTIICQSATAKYAFLDQTITNRIIQGISPTTSIFDGAGASVRWTVSGPSQIKNLGFEDINTTSGDIIKTILIGGDITISNCIFNQLLMSSSNSIQTLIGNGTNNFAGGGSLVATQNLNIINCVFYNPSVVSGSSTNNAGVVGGSTQGSTSLLRVKINITNCVIYLLTASTFYLNNFASLYNGSGGNGDITFTNTILYNETGKTVNLRAFSAGTDVKNYCDEVSVSNTIAGTGNITSDPLFVDRVNGNFNLRPTSPCINTGILT